MVPDPVCASCRGSFVEKMENPNDDPRVFAHEGDGHANDLGQNGMPPEFTPLFLGIQTLMDRGMMSNTPQSQRSTQNPQSFTFSINDPNGVRTIRLGGGAHPLGGEHDGDIPLPGPHDHRIPNMSTFIHSGPQTDHERPSIAGARMAQYLMAMLGNGGTRLGMPGNGRMGDYVFNQEALDQIITQMMENSNANRPVPATEELVENLPREVLLEKSPTLEKDCAVCKEQFKLETDDPDEQVVITLPCNHPFHEPCILPWLKSSGTCPVCRHALVPQPEHHSTPPRPDSGPEGGSGGSRNPTQNGPNQAGPSGLFQNFFSSFPGFDGNSSSNSNSSNGNNGSRSHNHHSRSSSSSRPPRRRSDPPYSSRENNNREHFPGSWVEELD